MTGSIPPELGNHGEQQTLSLYRNQLSGEIPPEFGAQGQLTRLYLHGNRLTGSIPPELGSIPMLEILWRQDNAIAPETPASLAGVDVRVAFDARVRYCEPPEPTATPTPAPTPEPTPEPTRPPPPWRTIIVERTCYTEPDIHRRHNIPDLRLTLADGSSSPCRFLTYYEANGDLPCWGFAISEVLAEQPGVLTQYF